VRIFLAGVGCVGKSTIGARLAELTGRYFFDLDTEIESYFGLSIEQLQRKYWMPHDFHREAAKALRHLLDQPESQQAVIALPPSGLMGGYLAVIKKAQGLKVVLEDTPERILDRVVFYDADSKLMDWTPRPEDRPQYLREIKRDIAYFRPSYKRADLHVSIEGLDLEHAARHLRALIDAA